MSGPSLEDLPDEVLLRIFRYVRGDRFPSRKTQSHRDRRGSTCATLWGLCLVSRKLTGAATEVLYENVDLAGNHIRNVLKTAISTSRSIGLVRRLKVAPVDNYRPHASYYTSGRELDVRMLAWAEIWSLQTKFRTHPGHVSLIPDAGLEQALCLLAVPDLKSIDLRIETAWGASMAISSRPMQVLQLLGGQGRKPPKFMKSLQSLTMRHTMDGPGHITVPIMTPLLNIHSLHSLNLKRVDSSASTGGDYRCSPNASIDTILQSMGIQSATNIRSLTLTDCRIHANDLEILVRVLPQLESLQYRCNFRHEISLEAEESVMRTSHLVACLIPVASILTQLRAIGAEEKVGYWEELLYHQPYRNWNRNRAPTPPTAETRERFDQIVEKLRRNVNYSKLTGLKHCDVSGATLAVNYSTKDDILPTALLPPSLQTLHIRLPSRDFLYTDHEAHHSPAVRTENTQQLLSMMDSLCKRIGNLRSEIPTLEHVSLSVPSDWPQPDRDLMSFIIDSTRSDPNLRISIAGNFAWAYDSSNTVSTSLGIFDMQIAKHVKDKKEKQRHKWKSMEPIVLD